MSDSAPKKTNDGVGVSISDERREGIKALIDNEAHIISLIKTYFDENIEEAAFRRSMLDIFTTPNPFRLLHYLLSLKSVDIEGLAKELDLPGNFKSLIKKLKGIHYRIFERMGRLAEQEDGYYNTVIKVNSRAIFLAKPRTPAIHVEYSSFEETLFKTSTSLINYAAFILGSMQMLRECLNHFRNAEIKVSEGFKTDFQERLNSIAELAESLKEQNLD